MLRIISHQTRVIYYFVGSVTMKHGVPVYPKPVKLVPGTNIIRDPNVIKALMDNAEFKAAVQAAQDQRRLGQKLQGLDIEEIPDATPEDAKASEAAGGKVNPYASTPTKKMKEIIEDISDIKALEEMLETETRAPVVTMLTARVKKLREEAGDTGDEDK